MLKLVAYINDLNYIKILNKFLPGLEDFAPAKGISKIIPHSWKDGAALLITSLSNEKIVHNINSQLKKSHIPISIKELEISKLKTEGSRMLRLEVVLNEIDYNELVKSVVPQVLESMAKKNNNNGDLARLLIEKSLPVKMLMAALDTLPQQEKDDLVAEILSIYKDDLKKVLYQTLEQQNLSVEIEKLNITSEKLQ